MSAGGGALELDDGSGAPVTVAAPGLAGIAAGDYVTVTGLLSTGSGELILKADPDDVIRLAE